MRSCTITLKYNNQKDFKYVTNVISWEYAETMKERLLRDPNIIEVNVKMHKKTYRKSKGVNYRKNPYKN